MNWELKVEMVRLGNNQNTQPDFKKQFYDFCILNVSKFDLQAWDMFVNLCEIIPDQMIIDLSFWVKIYEHIKNISCNNPAFNFRAGVRVSLIQTILEEIIEERLPLCENCNHAGATFTYCNLHNKKVGCDSTCGDWEIRDLTKPILIKNTKKIGGTHE